MASRSMVADGRLFTLNPWHLVRKWVNGGDLLFPLLFSSPRLVTCFQFFLLCLPLNSDTAFSLRHWTHLRYASFLLSLPSQSPLVSSTHLCCLQCLTYTHTTGCVVPIAQTPLSTSKIVLTTLFCLVKACLAAVVQFIEPYTSKNCNTNEAAFPCSPQLYWDIIYIHHCLRLRWTV